MQRRPSLREPGGHAGFTLIELMFTVMLAALLLAVAIPSFRSMTAANRLTTQTNDLIGAINLARSEAITRNTSARFCRADEEDATDCAGDSDNWTFWIVINANGTVLRRGSVPDYGGSITMTSDLTEDTATFSADGLARTGGGLISDNTITVCSNAVEEENTRHLVIGAGSRISTVKDSGC